MRIVFMGTPDFAVSSLTELINSGHKVAAVFTRKDAPKNRNMKLYPPPVKVCAEQYGIPVYQPVSLKNEKWTALLKEIDPEIIVVAAYGKILPKSVLSIPKYGCINVHASLLPKYRGASPINSAILNGETETGVSIMLMNEGLDTGDVILKKAVPISDTDSYDRLHDTLAKEGGDLLLKAISLIESGNASFEKQNDALSSYAPMIKNEDAALDFSLDAKSVSAKIRAFDSVPGAYCFLDNVKVKFFSARLIENVSINAPGLIIRADKKGMIIGCAKGAFEISEIQLAGGKRMPVSAFLSGHRDMPGKQFSSVSNNE